MTIYYIIIIILLFIFSLFPAYSGLFDNVGLTLAISAASLFLATLYLFFDLKQAQDIVESGAPKQFEWMAAFGIAYTILWFILILAFYIIGIPIGLGTGVML